MANENQIKSPTTIPFVYKASSSDIVREYEKTNSVWLRNHDVSAKTQQKERAATASKWLDQLLETKYDDWA